MNSATAQKYSVFGRLRILLDSVKFEHSIFALPFAYIGMVLAARGLPDWWQIVWITVAMVAARTLAMSANRLIDRWTDARNPRTSGRALPSGRLKASEMAAMAILAAIVFFFASAQLNQLAFILSPVAAVIVVGYSYTKRVTWLCHVALGIADGIAPVGGWIAVTGEMSWTAVLLAAIVATWIGGFDLIYACQDVEFDRREGLHSVAARFGAAASLWTAKAAHLLTSIGLLALGPIAGLGAPYYLGWAIATGLLAYENLIVKPDDLSRLGVAFFNVNGYIAIVVFVFTMIGLYVHL